MPTPTWLSGAIASYGYVGLFLVVIVEGPIATIIAAFLASQGILDVWLVYLVVVLGDLTGDFLYYGAGRSGRTVFGRWGKLSEPRQRRLTALKDRFRARAGPTLLMGKITHAAGFLVLFAAGAARVPVATFLWYSVLGTLPKSALLVAIGYVAGAAYVRINAYLGIATLIAFPLICLGLLIYLRKRLALDEP